MDNTAAPIALSPKQSTVLSNEAAGTRALSSANQWLASLSQPALLKALPMLTLLGVAALAAGLWWYLQSPASVPVFQGLAEQDKSAVAETLQGAGISYSLDSASGTLMVPQDQLHQARMLLAAQGLPKAAPAGDAIIAAMPMGSSRAVEGETLRGAREADLARTIEAIDAVESARIHLATPQPSAFVRDAVTPSASVMLTLRGGRTLSDSQVQSIRFLVASAVNGMKPEMVSVVDQAGNLLSADNPDLQDRNFQLKMQIEERYRSALAALLGPMVGVGNFSAEVSAEIDYSESQSTRETYPKDDQALRREQGNRTTGNGTGQAAGIPGATANEPPPATTVTTEAPVPGQEQGQPATLAEESYARSFDVGREISVTHQPQGNVKRLSVAVVLSTVPGKKPPTPAQLAEIEKLVKGAVGFDAARGDVVALSTAEFPREPVVEVALWDQPWFMQLVRQAAGLVGALALLFFVGRPLIRAVKARTSAANQTAANGAEPMAEADMIALENELLSQSLGAGRKSGNDPLQIADQNADDQKKKVHEFVRSDPERAAAIVRQLMEGADNG
jgi:flagellar M-ring protein FliF